MNSDERVDLSFRAAEPFVHGLRVAVLLIAATVLFSFSILRSLPLYRPLWLQWVAFVILATLLLMESIFVLRRRSWGSLRWWGLGATVVVSVAAAASLPAEAISTPANWAFGTVGWFGLILLLDRPLSWTVGFLVVHWGVVVGFALLPWPPDRDALLVLASGSLGAIGYPLASAIAATALRRIASRAETAVRQVGELRSAGSVAARVHDQRQQRLRELRETAVPLLQGLAEGTVDPDDRDFQRACAIEAARLRRLFAEADDVDDPLLHELEHCVELAERRGVLVEWERRGSWPSLPVDVRRALTDGPLAVLATAATCARVSIVGTVGELGVSVVADSGALDLSLAPHPAVHVRTVPAGAMLWVEARWTG